MGKNRMKKLRTMLYILLSLISIAAIGVAIFLQQPKFGRKAQGERKVRMEKSPYYKNGQMENEIPTEKMTGESGFVGTMLKFVTGAGKSDRVIPQEGEVPLIKTDLKQLPDSSDLYVWFGHSSFLLRLNGKNVLVDPTLVAASPVKFYIKAFPGTDYYKPEMMPDRIDYLVISHDHWDHLDYETVTALKDRIDHVVCPLGIGEDFEYWGFSKEQIVELDCNENYTFSTDSFTFHCLPTRHFSGRSITDAMQTQRASWLIETPKRTIFYTGDGGYSDRFERYGQQFPNIDLAIMENGQYSVNWNQIHTLPEQLGLEVKGLHPNRFITVHHSKYPLSSHAWDEPRINEQRASIESGVPVIVAQIGEVIKLDSIKETTNVEEQPVTTDKNLQ